jgi:hypothetical protein
LINNLVSAWSNWQLLSGWLYLAFVFHRHRKRIFDTDSCHVRTM